MLERALMAVLMIGAAMVLVSVAERFHPIKLAAQAIGSVDCEGEGWSAEACSAR